MKADAIAKRMAEMAAKADGAWQEVSKAKAKTAAGFAEAQATAKATKSAESRAEKRNTAAEDQAQAGSAKLAAADKQVQSLLQKRQHLEDMRMAEDEKQTTRLADAFQQDALRQNAFKQAMLRAKASEAKQLMLNLASRQRQDREAAEAVSARRSSYSMRKEASISQLKALEHSLLRANPELESLRPRGSDSAGPTGGGTSGQTLAGHFGGVPRAESAYKARWQQLAAVEGPLSSRQGAAATEDDGDDFTVPASDSPRI